MLKNNLNQILGVVNTLSESQKRNREDDIIKAIKNICRFRKETNNSATNDLRNIFRPRK